MDTLRGTADDLARTLAFVRDAFAKWREKGVIRGEEYDLIDATYKDLKQQTDSGRTAANPLALPSSEMCWSCKAPVGATHYCGACGAPAHTEAVDQLRYLVCLCHEIKKHEQAGRLDLSAAHGCLADANGRIAALRRKLDRQRAPSAIPVGAPAKSSAELFTEAPPPSPEGRGPTIPAPRRNFLEMLLDPRSIQWLLASGAAVLVLGVVIWLAASGLFDYPIFTAVVMAVGNALLLAGGWALIRFTRYQLAGRAVTLLACLLMPLNLWFYDHQGLITIAEGGHLWLAALVCCVLYAVSASLLRDPMLVFVFVGGVALTGLLLLADHLVEHFWEASAPAVFLVGLGLACIHVERAFLEDEGPFSRKRFGLPFFWSGQAVLAAGLLLVLGAQLTGTLLLFDTSFNEFYYKTFDTLETFKFVNRPDLVTSVGGQLLALALVAAGTYAYVYSDLVVRKVGIYIHLAVIGFLWAEVLLLNLAFQKLPDLPHIEAYIVALALTGLAANFALTALLPPASLLRRTGPALALGLCVVPLLLGIMLHIRAVALPAWDRWHHPLGWSYVAAMAVTAVACRVGAFLHRAERPWLATVYLFGSAGAVLLGAAGLLRTLNPDMPWEQQAPLLMLIPLAYLIASRLYRGRPTETAVVWAAHAGTVILLVSCLDTAFQGFALQQGQLLNLLLAAFFAEAALFYLLAAIWRDREFAVYACTAAAAAAVWQILTFYKLEPEYYIGAFAILGLLLLVAYRFAALEKGATIGLGRAAFQSANALLSLAAVAGALLSLSALAGKQIDLGRYVGLDTVLTATSAAALFLVRHANWRRWYLLAAVGNGALTILVLLVQADLSGWQKLELICLVIGAALLIASHLGWYREQERENDLVSFGLFLGSMLVGVPLYCLQDLRGAVLPVCRPAR